ncbi:hypothetical protein A4H97_05630 [Niastella yeongjuensis]|uniref:Histidine kinase N-terminal 7TM region domain-containing protein n=1 Tax=Niastella yeongjuensis TaxID=354355 RepID=A0A1V9ELH3_9BACT|nr:hypothetical protein [Niastella yeongjuensis]OQP46997.1 hypothetical protein A4H97_05630 [Niastella yeongjuensis]SEN64730.1 hypothetical protein SAMN05660816_01151 [Niastella yeongjuensis]
MITIFFNSYLILLVICFIVGVICTWRLKWSLSPVKMLPWFVLLTFISEMTALQWMIKYHNNHCVYNVYQVLQFVFYSFALYQLIKNRQIRKVLLFVSIGYPVFAIINLFVRGIHLFNIVNFYGGAVMLAFFSGYLLSELFRKTAIDNPFRMPAFWTGSSILVQNSCLIPLELPAALSLTFSPGEVNILVGMIMVVNFISYTLFIIGFIHLYKNSKTSTLYR